MLNEILRQSLYQFLKQHNTKIADYNFLEFSQFQQFQQQVYCPNYIHPYLYTSIHSCKKMILIVNDSLSTACLL